MAKSRTPIAAGLPTTTTKKAPPRGGARRLEVDLDVRTLEEAQRDAEQSRWVGRRCYKTMQGQCAAAIAGVNSAALSVAGRPRKAPLRVCDVTTQMVKAAARSWGPVVAPATIHKRLSALAAMGVDVTGCRVRLPHPPKWWLTPEAQEDLRAALPNDSELMAYIDWAVQTGLRVEESLRLRRSHFFNDSKSLTVPGTKTAGSQATIALSKAAQAIVQSRFAPDARQDAPMFTFNYRQLSYQWDCAKALAGIDHPLATLKALRRSAARALTVTKGMPLEVLKGYLRHRSITTTIGYLNLVGGHTDEEQRKWLD